MKTISKDDLEVARIEVQIKARQMFKYKLRNDEKVGLYRK